MRDEEPHRVRRGYFNCAKSYLMLERGCNVKIFLLSHRALTFSSHVMGEIQGWDKGAGGLSKRSFLLIVCYIAVKITLCTFIAAIQRSPNENSCQMEMVAHWMR